MSGSAVLLLRRAGRVWGVLAGTVREVARGGGKLVVSCTDGSVMADEIIGVRTLTVQRTCSVLNRFWPNSCEGLAVFRESPLVVVNPNDPPPSLRVAEGGSGHAEPRRSKA